jgi:hypothetical protein
VPDASEYLVDTNVLANRNDADDDPLATLMRR